jgi:RNA polymerase sigma-70 factor (ECF subfamily)
MSNDRIEGRVEGDAARRVDMPPGTAGNNHPRDAAAPLSQAAVAALIEQNYVGLRLLVARRCRDPNVAADLLNEAVVTTWSKWQAGKIERPEQIAGYVLQVTMNLLRNHRRAIAERPEKRADAAKLQDLAGEGEPGDETIEREIAVQVKNVIRAMSSQRDRAILVRFYLDEEEKEIICRDLGLSPLQFDKILHRARGRLRKLLESGGLGRNELLSLFPFL